MRYNSIIANKNLYDLIKSLKGSKKINKGKMVKMFKKVHELNFSEKKFSVLVSGKPGVGKTTLALSAPKPVLFDFDNGADRVNPSHLSDVFVVEDYEKFLKGLEAPEMDYFETVVIDTGGALINYMADWVIKANPKNGNKNGALSLQGFGALKNEFKRLTDVLKRKLNKHVVYVFHTSEKSKRVGGEDVVFSELMADGSAKDLVWQFVDLGAHFYMTGGVRALGFTPTDTYSAKGSHGVQGVKMLPELTSGDSNNFLTKMFEDVTSKLLEGQKKFSVEKQKYEEVMNKGRELIEKVKTTKQANSLLKKIDELEHSLTSEKELKTIARNHVMGELGYKWKDGQFVESD